VGLDVVVVLEDVIVRYNLGSKVFEVCGVCLVMKLHIDHLCLIKPVILATAKPLISTNKYRPCRHLPILSCPGGHTIVDRVMAVRGCLIRVCLLLK
jgi:hypothetical protein